MNILLYKVIFRLDFKVCYKLLDSPGRTLQLLNIDDKSDDGSHFWDEVGESSGTRALVASSSDDICSRNLTINPTSIYGSIEWASGIVFDSLLSDAGFKTLMSIAEEVRKNYDLIDFQRAGFRVWVCSGSQPFDNPIESFTTICGKDYNELAGSLGKVADFSIIIEGKSESSIFYKVNTGPYIAGDITNLLQGSYSKDVKDYENIHSCTSDIDLFTKDFSLPNTSSIARWCSYRTNEAKKFILKSNKLLKIK